MFQLQDKDEFLVPDSSLAHFQRIYKVIQSRYHSLWHKDNYEQKCRKMHFTLLLLARATDKLSRRCKKIPWVVPADAVHCGMPCIARVSRGLSSCHIVPALCSSASASWASGRSPQEYGVANSYHTPVSAFYVIMTDFPAISTLSSLFAAGRLFLYLPLKESPPPPPVHRERCHRLVLGKLIYVWLVY